MPSPFVTDRLDPKKRRRARKHEVFQIEDAPRIRWSAGKKFGGIVRELGAFGRSEKLGVNMEDLAPGQWNSTFHWHTHEEEHFFVLEGKGLMRVGRREIEVRAGSYVVFPPNGRVGHALRNTGRGTLRYIVIGTRESGDVCVYPDSKKINVRALRATGRLARTDYWDGEV